MIDSRQKRMAAMNLACVWRGPLVDAAESGFNAGNRAAADFMYSGFGAPPPPSGGVQVFRSPIRNMGGMMQGH